MLPDNVVRVWFTDLRVSPGEFEQLSALLNSEEIERSVRFRFPEGRRRFTVARAFLRQILGLHLDIEPGQVRFQYEPHGKPALAGPSELHFNLSHSDDVAAAAVARGQRVGIDIEVMRNKVDFEGIARRYFCASEADRVAHCHGTDQCLAFYAHWTGKEAYLKARGNGLFAPLDSFEVTPTDSGGLACLRIDDVWEGDRWSIRLIRPSEDIVCAVVAEGTEWHIETAEWSPHRCRQEPFFGREVL